MNKWAVKIMQAEENQLCEFYTYEMELYMRAHTRYGKAQWEAAHTKYTELKGN